MSETVYLYLEVCIGHDREHQIHRLMLGYEENSVNSTRHNPAYKHFLLVFTNQPNLQWRKRRICSLIYSLLPLCPYCDRFKTGLVLGRQLGSKDKDVFRLDGSNSGSNWTAPRTEGTEVND